MRSTLSTLACVCQCFQTFAYRFFCRCLPWLALVARGKECQELLVGLPLCRASLLLHHMAFGMHRLLMMSAVCSSSSQCRERAELGWPMRSTPFNDGACGNAHKHVHIDILCVCSLCVLWRQRGTKDRKVLRLKSLNAEVFFAVAMAWWQQPLASLALTVRVSEPAGRICSVAADVTTTVRALKAEIESRSEISAEIQRLFHGNVELTHATALGELVRIGGCAGEVELLLVRRSPLQLALLRQVARLGGSGALRWWLEKASPDAIEDREVILDILAEEPMALQYAAPALRADRDVVMTAVVRDHRALEYASAELLGDREIVLTAVRQDGNALGIASPKLRADRGVVLVAAAQLGDSIRHASLELRADPEVVLTAVRQDFNALRFTLTFDKKCVRWFRMSAYRWRS